MSFLRWCERCRAEGFESPVRQFRVTRTSAIEMCQRLECTDLLPGVFKLSVQKDFASRSKQVAASKECQSPRLSTSSVPEALINTHVADGASSSSIKETSVYACDNTPAVSLSAISGQETIRDKKRKKRSGVKDVPSSFTREPPVCVSDYTPAATSTFIPGKEEIQDKNRNGTSHVVDSVPSSSTEEPVFNSTSSELLSAISGQKVVQDKNRTLTSHVVEAAPSSPTKKRPIHVSVIASSESSSAISGQEMVEGKNRKETSHMFEGILSSFAKEPLVFDSDSTSAASSSAISGQDKTRKEASCASNMGQLDKTLTTKFATWSAAVVLAVPGETEAEESDFVSASLKDAVEDQSGENKHCEKTVAPLASDGSLENGVKFSVLADKADENALAGRTSEHSEYMCHVDGTALKLEASEAKCFVASDIPDVAMDLGSSALRVAPHMARKESITKIAHTHESRCLAVASGTSPVALSVAPEKQEMTKTFEKCSRAALKPLSHVFGLPDRSEVGLPGNLQRTSVAMAVESPRCCQKVKDSNHVSENNSGAIVKPTADTPSLPKNGEVGLHENFAVAGGTSFIGPPTLSQEEKPIHHTVSDHYRAVGECMGNLERYERDVPESFTVASGASSSELLICPQEMQAGSSTAGSQATAIEELASGLLHKDNNGLRQSSVVTNKTSFIRPPTLVQEEEAGHQTTAAEPASSLSLFPDRSEGGASVSFMGVGGRSSPVLRTCTREQQASLKAGESHSPAGERPISDFSSMTSRDQVGLQQSSDVADKLSSIRLPTLPQQDGAGYHPALDHSPATSHTSCLPNKSGGSAPELFTTASGTSSLGPPAVVKPSSRTCFPDKSEGGAPELFTRASYISSLGPPVCPQEKTAGLRNLGSHTAAVKKPTRDLCGFLDGEGASLLQSPAVRSETSLVDLVTPQQEQKTSQYSTNSNDSSLTKPFNDVQGLAKENDLPENLAVACGLSLELPGPSANDMQGVVKPANVPSHMPDTDELDLQGNSAVVNKLSLAGPAKSSPERLEDSRKKAGDVSTPAVYYISEDNLSVGGEVTLQEGSEVDRKTPSVDTPRTLQKEQGSTENTVYHHDAVGAPIPCHTHELSSTPCVNLLGPAEGSLSAVVHNAQSMSKLESSQRKTGYHESAPTASGIIEASLPIRDKVTLSENSEANSNTPSAEIPSTAQTGLRGTESTVDGHVEAGGPCNTNWLPNLSSTSEDSVLDDDEDSLSAIMHIAETMSKLPTECPGVVPSTIGSFQQIFISPSTTAAKKTADVRGTAIMPAHSADGSGRGTELAEIPFMHIYNSGETASGGSSSDVVPIAAVPLAAVSSGQAVIVTAERTASGAMKVKNIVVTLPSKSTVPGECSQAMQSTNTRAQGLKRPHSSAGSENEGLSEFPTRLDSRKRLAIINELCPESISAHVGRTSRTTKRGAQASKSARKGHQTVTRSRQRAAARTGRKQVSGCQRKGKQPSKHPEHMVPDVLHPVPSPLSSESSCASSKPSNDGSSGPSDTTSAPYMSAKLRSRRSSTWQSSSSTSGSTKASFMETIRNRILQKTASENRLPDYHSALASRPLYRDEVPVRKSKRKRTVENTGDVDIDLDRYISELSATKDLEQYQSLLSDLFDVCM